MSKRGKTLRVPLGAWFVLLLAIAVAVALYLRQGVIDRPKPLSVPSSGESRVPPVIASGSHDEPTADGQAPCREQQIELTLGDQTRTMCVGATRTIQNGSVREYRVESVGTPAQSLRVQTSGKTVLAVSLATGSAREFRCAGNDCVGVEIGPRDSTGARTITLEKLLLTAGSSADEADPENRVLVSGTLKTLPEDRIAGLACTEQGVSIITSDGSSGTFCPRGGAGFEIGDDGRRTYRFTSLEGETILVAVDESHRVLKVEYQGDNTLACGAAACRTHVSEPTTAGERVFTFSGATLLDTSGDARNAVLNGTLIVPPL